MNGTAVPSDRQIIRRSRKTVNGRIVQLACACCITICIACSSEGKANKLYDEAAAQVREGNLDSAVQQFDDLIDRYPETTAAGRARQQVQVFRGLAKAESMFPLRETRDTMIATARALQFYRDRNRTWPGRLEQLVPRHLPELPVDSWGQSLKYQRKSKNRGYLLGSFGADRKRGGDEGAGDLFIEDGKLTQTPSVEFR